MGYQTRITIEVINEDGEVVNHRGHTHKIELSRATPLATTVTFKPTEKVDDALDNLNGLFQIITKVKDFKEL